MTAPPSPTPPHRCKPWRWVGHLLGHEAKGSLAHALKQAGLIQVNPRSPHPRCPPCSRAQAGRPHPGDLSTHLTADNFRQLLLRMHPLVCCLPSPRLLYLNLPWQ